FRRRFRSATTNPAPAQRTDDSAPSPAHRRERRHATDPSDRSRDAPPRRHRGAAAAGDRAIRNPLFPSPSPHAARAASAQPHRAAPPQRAPTATPPAPLSPPSPPDLRG